jgi:hypothetical protein
MNTASLSQILKDSSQGFREAWLTVCDRAILQRAQFCPVEAKLGCAAAGLPSNLGTVRRLVVTI